MRSRAERLEPRGPTCDAARMRTTSSVLILTSVILACSARAGGDVKVFVDDFESGSSAGGWTFGPPPMYPLNGGNPGRYLRVTDLDTFAPQPRTTTTDSPFTGNFREKNVTKIGVDLQTFDVDFSAAERPCTLMLINNNGTPANGNDDWAVYFMGPDIPLVGEDWKSFTFDIPAQSKQLPAGWKTIQLGGSSPRPDWNTAIEDVDRVQFFYGDPEFFFIFQQWTLGLDNAFVQTSPSVVGDLDGDGSVSSSDLAILLGAWGGDGPADLDEDGDVGPSDLAILLGNWS